MNTHCIVVLFLAQDKAELWMVMIWLLKFRPEDYHDAILEEIIELDGI